MTAKSLFSGKVYTIWKSSKGISIVSNQLPYILIHIISYSITSNSKAA